MTTDFESSFGFEAVTPAERRRRIRRIFQAVAVRYDLMNDVMSMGVHRLWKRTLARMAARGAGPGALALDLGGGTGDIAALMGARGLGAVVCDPSENMMTVGRWRRPELAWVGGAGEALPFADGTFDVVTMAFALRNVTRIEDCLDEVRRVLRPGGRFLVLEFSRPVALVRPFYDLYSFHLIPRLGAWIARQPGAYAYLVQSIRRFPDQKALAALLRQQGFEGVGYRNLSFGIAAIHQGTKG